MKTIGLLEAAAFYDFRKLYKGKAGFPIYDLVFSVDNFTVGLCKCEKNGTVTLLASRSAEDEDYTWPEEIGKMVEEVCGCNETELYAHWDEKEIFRKIKAFIKSGRTINPSLILGPKGELKTDTYIRLFERVTPQIKRLADEALALINQFQLEETACRFILIGSAVKLKFPEYILREKLSFDPLIADGRFINDQISDDADAVSQIGQTLYTEFVFSQNTIELLYVGTDNKTYAVNLAAENAQADKPVHYFGPVLAADNELTFLIDHKIFTAKLRFHTEQEELFSILDAGVGRGADNTCFLSIRKSNSPGEVIRMKLPDIAGEAPG